MQRKLLEPPARLPVSLLEARAHQRLSSGLDDDELGRLIREATTHVQRSIGCQLVASRWRVGRDRFPAGKWPLWPWPLVSVETVSYLDGNGATQTLSASNYQVDSLPTPGLIAPAYGYSWPSARPQSNSVTIDLVAGCAVPVTGYDEAANSLTVGVYVPANGDRVWMTTDDVLPEGLSPDTLYYVVNRDDTARTVKLATSSGGTAIDITDSGSGQHWLHLGQPDLWDQARRAILLLCDHWWEHRGDQVESSPLREIQHGVQRILDQLDPGADFLRAAEDYCC